MKRSIQKGFTLIELMIVVAIIGILAAIALPAYQDYTIRTQVSEGQTLMAGAKTAVTEFWSQRGSFPGSNASAGISPAGSIVGSYVTQVAVGSGGAITATYGKKANSKITNGTCTITPADAGGSVTWTGTCNNTIQAKWRSAAFR